ncbi:hypothetical protein M5D96_014109 [Drosophila gunungcola]|uniref:Uncharacterized protein n=1 Tax=Drosophila gunungcola TaxID=103775 RepID=A0A9P9YA41_9MUSC|nr:hypothetical protein M5D96_014109 [Drosophila gunungcola]
MDGARVSRMRTGMGLGIGLEPSEACIGNNNNNDGRAATRSGCFGGLDGAHMHPLDCQLRPHHISSSSSSRPEPEP